VSRQVPGAHAPKMAAPSSVLVVVTRRMGDVLLAAPLIRSLKAAWPQTVIDVLVFASTRDVLAGHPDVRRVLAVAERPGMAEHAAFIIRLVRRYDLALSCLAGDRPTLYARLAGRRSFGLVAPGSRARWKRWLLTKAVAFDDLDTHTVAMNLALADALGIARQYDSGIRWSADAATRVASLIGGGERPPAYAVLHAHPKYRYKMWHAEGWAGLARWLHERGIVSVLTGGGEPAEIEFVAAVAATMPAGTINLAGRMSFDETACAIASARLFVGTDTVTTHLAAALGVPTVALFGPSNPVKWGPWPREFSGASSPWRRVGGQAAANVELVQGVGACVPCMREGCDQHVASNSDCLRQLPLSTVIDAAERALVRMAASPAASVPADS
jgi:lipopolysaccharide heptosyltransferase III